MQNHGQPGGDGKIVRSIRKQIVDRAFCEGLNRITYHGYSHSPKEVGYPGRTYHAGVDMNPQVVWWSKARPFMDYLGSLLSICSSRVSLLLTLHITMAIKLQTSGHHCITMFPEKPLLDGLGAGYDYDVVNSGCYSQSHVSKRWPDHVP